MRRSSLALCLGLPLLLLACGDKDEDDTGDDGPVDVDGDGVTADEDCDDNDAAAFPGNEETWYDGIDGDCLGDDDYDADADGVRSDEHGGADCDDTDASIYPSAEETWYDGVDSDCAGDNDNDADVDGFDGVDGGGDDCDDQEPTTYPGAPDTWYDGVDSDCAGDSDYDADVDGFDSEASGGEDCDDTDAGINPAVEETWYDGVDGNCDSEDDFDADMDGQQSDDHGGSDCDDNDATVMYGVVEKLDGKDTDCDGSADSYTLDEDWGGTLVEGVESGGALGITIEVFDYDGDGLDDIVTTNAFASPSEAYFFSGTTLTAGDTTTAGADLAVTQNDSYFSAWALFPGLTSGTDYVAFAAAEDLDELDYSVGAVYLLTTGELGTVTDVSEASISIWGVSEVQPIGGDVANAGDLTGDGTDELIFNDLSHSYYVFDGATVGAAAQAWLASDASATWTDEEPVHDGWGPGVLQALGDLDGDGYGEVLLGQAEYGSGMGRVIIMEGDISLTSDDVDNLAWASITGDGSADAVGTSVSTGDVDGDGLPDVVLGAPGQDSLGGRAHVVMGADLTAGTHSLGDVSHVSYTGATVFGDAGFSVASGHDSDGDGLDDLVIGGPGNSGGGTDAGEAYFVSSGQSGARALADAAWRFEGTADEDYAGAAVGMGDFDGDGLGDIVFGAYGKDATLGGEGAVYVGFSGY